MSASDWIALVVGIVSVVAGAAGVFVGALTTYLVEYNVAKKQMMLEALATLVSHTPEICGQDFIDGLCRVKLLFANCKGFSENYLRMMCKMKEQDPHEKMKAVLDFIEYLYGCCGVEKDRSVLEQYVKPASQNANEQQIHKQ